MRTEIDRGDWFDPDSGRQLLRAYSEDWLASRRVRGRPLAPRTSERYNALLKVHIVPGLGHLSLARLDPAAIRDWHAGLLNAGAPGPATVAKAYRLLHAICTTAVVEQKIPRNPCMIPGASVETNPERPIATLGQVYELAEAVGERWRALVLLGTFCGLRFGELAGLTRVDVDLELAVVVVRADLDELDGGRLQPGEVKSAASRRTVSIPEALLDEVRHHLDTYAEAGTDGSVFVGPAGGRLRRSTSASRCGFQRPRPSGSTACASMTSGIRGTPSRLAPAPAPASSWHAWVTRVPARRSSTNTQRVIATPPSRRRCPS